MQVRLDELKHAAEGIVRSSGQLKEMRDQDFPKEEVDLQKLHQKVHNNEQASYNCLQMVGRWFVNLVEEVELCRGIIDGLIEKLSSGDQGLECK